ncbi:hypothetical protein PBI_KAMPE_96 [Gordonia phage Kampe]|uniref:Lipoprotein n=3 Tax=Gordonia phage Orchid TaxID=1838075 RepID=A0A160DH85_9CAUD|nr:hypothetical protein PBI_PATRICKSTAR_96 [Gordonia phage PatrickStar]ANA87556.1 hypothetical protein PBI_KAMPE_96 [Gordonia phage Kampe]
MSMKKLIALVFMSLFIVTACGDEVEHGEVIEKRYNEESTSLILVPVCDAKGICTQNQIWQTNPESWEIRLRDCVKRNDDGECRTQWREVSETTYEEIEIGDEV